MSKILNMTIEDVAWTIHNFKDDILEWENLDSSERFHNEDKNPYYKIANAALIVANKGFGDCYDVNDFINYVKEGYFTNYDGIGYFIDKDGNELGAINCDDNWLHKHIPTDAAFIMWYNK